MKSKTPQLKAIMLKDTFDKVESKQVFETTKFNLPVYVFKCTNSINGKAKEQELKYYIPSYFLGKAFGLSRTLDITLFNDTNNKKILKVLKEKKLYYVKFKKYAYLSMDMLELLLKEKVIGTGWSVIDYKAVLEDLSNAINENVDESESDIINKIEELEPISIEKTTNNVSRKVNFDYNKDVLNKKELIENVLKEFKYLNRDAIEKIAETVIGTAIFSLPDSDLLNQYIAMSNLFKENLQLIINEYGDKLDNLNAFKQVSINTNNESHQDTMTDYIESYENQFQDQDQTIGKFNITRDSIMLFAAHTLNDLMDLINTDRNNNGYATISSGFIKTSCLYRATMFTRHEKYKPIKEKCTNKYINISEIDSVLLCLFFIYVIFTGPKNSYHHVEATKEDIPFLRNDSANASKGLVPESQYIKMVTKNVNKYLVKSINESVELVYYNDNNEITVTKICKDISIFTKEHLDNLLSKL